MEKSNCGLCGELAFSYEHECPFLARLKERREKLGLVNFDSPIPIFSDQTHHVCECPGCPNKPVVRVQRHFPYCIQHFVYYADYIKALLKRRTTRMIAAIDLGFFEICKSGTLRVDSQRVLITGGMIYDTNKKGEYPDDIFDIETELE